MLVFLANLPSNLFVEKVPACDTVIKRIKFCIYDDDESVVMIVLRLPRMAALLILSELTA
ncbi:hypothetical protein OUZ56_030689 [Daphnia magna]|uniref:Uncharacterized protein n=1 Tax=Daphnia magna TaxID=35525 RepID=A0ABQ9ZSX4_9CRUS|nr:hypothetical protein OUZ56_030689 [Daphnia magna]